MNMLQNTQQIGEPNATPKQTTTERRQNKFQEHQQTLLKNALGQPTKKTTKQNKNTKQKYG